MAPSSLRGASRPSSPYARSARKQMSARNPADAAAPSIAGEEDVSTISLGSNSATARTSGVASAASAGAMCDAGERAELVDDHGCEFGRVHLHHPAAEPLPVGKSDMGADVDT